jgi:hypothetical protein
VVGVQRRAKTDSYRHRHQLGERTDIHFFHNSGPMRIFDDTIRLCWAQHLRDGKASLTRFRKILHAEYPLGEAFHIANVAQPEDDSPKVVVAGRVDPAGEKDAYKITFSELGWPPAYSCQTSLTIRPQDRRVLRVLTTSARKPPLRSARFEEEIALLPF